MTTVRSDKENIVTFRTPRTGEKVNHSATARKPNASLRTPATVNRVPLGGKNANIKQNITTGKQGLSNKKKEFSSSVKKPVLRSTPLLNTTHKSKPLFTVSADQSDELALPIQCVLDDVIDDIEYAPSPEKPGKEYDDLDIDIDFDWVKRSLKVPVFLQPTGDLDEPIISEVYEDSQVKRLFKPKNQNQLSSPYSKKLPLKYPSPSIRSTSTSSGSALSPEKYRGFMAPTSSTLNKRTKKLASHSDFTSPSMSHDVPGDYINLSSEDILGNLDDQLF